jgi:hypothetical protein
MGKLNDMKTPILLDTGSSLTIASPKRLEKFDPSQKPNLIDSNVRLKSANRENIPVLGECPLPITLKDKSDMKVTHTILIANTESDFILGVDFMMKFSCSICLKGMVFQFRGIEIPCFRNANKTSNPNCSRTISRAFHRLKFSMSDVFRRSKVTNHIPVSSISLQQIVYKF